MLAFLSSFAGSFVLMGLYQWDLLDKQPRRALWVWKPITDNTWDGKPSWQQLIDNHKGSADLLIDFCRNKSIRVLYLYIGAWQWEQSYFNNAQLYNEDGYAYIISKAKSYGMKVYALFYINDDPNDLSGAQTAITKIVDSVVAYNERHPDAMFVGLQNDQEPYNSSVYEDFLNMLKTGHDRILYHKDQGSSGAQYLVLSSTIKPSWVTETFNYNGNSKPMYQHVMDLVDHGALMAYYDSDSEILNVANPVVNYASTIGKPVAVGVETGWVNVNDPNTFNDEIQAESTDVRFTYFENEIGQVVDSLRSKSGFERIAIHDWAQYFYHWFGAQPADWLDAGNTWSNVQTVDLSQDDSNWASYPDGSGSSGGSSSGTGGSSDSGGSSSSEEESVPEEQQLTKSEVQFSPVFEASSGDTFRIDFNLDQESDVTILLYSMDGLPVYRTNKKNVKGQFSVDCFSADEVAPGVYFLVLKVETPDAIKKLENIILVRKGA